MPTRLIGDYASISHILSWVGYLSQGLILLVFTYLLLFDSIKSTFFHIHRKRVKNNDTLQDISESRKQFLTRILGGGVFLASTAIEATGIPQARNPKILKTEVFLKNLPEEFDGYKIAQISDLHVGLTIRRDYVERVVEITNSIGADSIALTGDFMDGSVASLAYDMEPIRSLKSKDGVFFCTGNHEYYSGAPSWMEYFRESGFHVLHNENRVVQRNGAEIYFCGVCDITAHRIERDHIHDVKKAVTGIPQEACKILLAHQPKSIYEASDNGIDLQLSGHTHAGQFFPGSLLVYLVQPYVKGLNLHKDTQIYINQGTGYWGPPMRNGTQSEISEITLRKSS
jgi:hypothetical protein